MSEITVIALFNALPERRDELKAALVAMAEATHREPDPLYALRVKRLNSRYPVWPPLNRLDNHAQADAAWIADRDRQRRDGAVSHAPAVTPRCGC